MIIKELKPYVEGEPHNYGRDYQVQIGKATAVKLCGRYQLPPMGSESCIRGVIDKIFVSNISGYYFLRSVSVSIDLWPALFDIEVKRCEESK
jgi:hypothetical protein